jgi:hypothetical protein
VKQQGGSKSPMYDVMHMISILNKVVKNQIFKALKHCSLDNNQADIEKAMLL